MPRKKTGTERRNLTYQEKLMVIQKKEQEPSWTQLDLAVWAREQFKLVKKPTQSTISNILHSREKLQNANVPPDCKSARLAKNPDLDAALIAWVLNMVDAQESLTRDAIQQKAAKLAREMHILNSISFSKGWLDSFMKRHQLLFRKKHGATGTESDVEIVRQPQRELAVRSNSSGTSPRQSLYAKRKKATGFEIKYVMAPEQREPLEPVLAWLTAPGNYVRWKMLKTAKTKQRILDEINRPLRVQGEPDMNPTEIRVKIATLVKSFKAARSWLMQHGFQETSRLEQINSAGNAATHVLNICPHYDLLASVLSEHVNDGDDDDVVPADELDNVNHLPSGRDDADGGDTTPKQGKRRKMTKDTMKREGDSMQQQLLYDLEREKLKCDIEAKQVQVLLEKILARKKLLDAGVAPAEVDKFFPL